MELQEKPPWQKEEEHRNTSLSLTSSYGTLSSTSDTSCLQMQGPPQSLSTLSSSQTLPSSSSSLSSSQSMDSSQTSSSGRHSTTTSTSTEQPRSLVGYVQSPQKFPQSHGSPSGSSQSTLAAAAYIHPSDQPRLEPAHISMPPNTQVVYPVTSKVVPGVGFQTSGKKNNVCSAGKNVHMTF